MRTLIFGSKGQIGSELVRAFCDSGVVRSFDSSEVNFLQPNAIVSAIESFQPTHIINAAAYTAVDKAEAEEEIATHINGFAVEIIAREAKKIGAVLIHYSTDYVFDGSQIAPYSEDDTPNPLNAYGRSKLKGEELIQKVGGNYVILRVSWIYGNHGNNFYRTMLRLGSEREELKVVNDQIGAPTWSRDVAEATAKICIDPTLKEKSGIYHLSPQGETSWFEFANQIFKEIRNNDSSNILKINKVFPIHSSEYPTPAKRPLNSRMRAAKIKKSFGIQLPDWSESLRLVVRQRKALEPKLIQFNEKGDHRGALVALEGKKNIPFEIRRVYFIYNNISDVRRGFHAHKNLRQVAVAVHGSCKMLLDDGKEKVTVVLDSPSKGLLIEGVIWRELFDFSSDCVLLVLADQAYEESDYIRDYSEFLKIAKNKNY